MVIIQKRSRRKVSGGRYIAARKKKKYDMGRAPTLTKLDKTEKRQIKTKGGGVKIRLLRGDEANLFDPKTKTYSKVKIKTVVENPANRHFIRRNIITRGAVVMTEKGKARITSRPGQEGVINAVLVSE
jgi:small subunit ribosomal protein S8e